MEYEYSYSAYGTRTVVNGYESVIGYCGRDGVLTENGGLCYMRARYYSPELMRFVNQDIVVGDISNSNSLNRYTYVEGNPATMVDPFGLCANKANPGKIVDGVVGTGKGFCETAFGAAAVVAGGTIITVAGAPVVIVGGLLLAGAGAISMIFGSGDMAEGIIDIGKGIVGDDSKTYNVGRDYLCGGDQQLYDTVEIGSMLVCGYGIGAANSYVASQSSSSGSITQNAKIDAASIGEETGTKSGYYQDANGKWHRPNGQFASNAEVGISSSIESTVESHGNSLSDPRTNYGYALVDKDTNEILKFGETLYPDTRYSQSYLEQNNAVMEILVSGSKEEIHYWQYDMNKYFEYKYDEFPRLLNSEGW